MGLYSSVGSVIYFRWYCGELYVVDPRIVVSTDRTRIRQSPYTVDFIERASKEFKKLAKYAESFSNRDNAEVVVKHGIERVTAIEEQVKSGVTRDRLPRIFSELGQVQSDIEKRKRHLVGTETEKRAEEAEEKVGEILDSLINATQGRDSLERQDGLLPLSDVVGNQGAGIEDIPRTAPDGTEAIVVLDIPDRLSFSPRETHLYATIMQAIADTCGGRDSKEFTKIAVAIETALVETFGE